LQGRPSVEGKSAKKNNSPKEWVGRPFFLRWLPIKQHPNKMREKEKRKHMRPGKKREVDVLVLCSGVARWAAFKKRPKEEAGRKSKFWSGKKERGAYKSVCRRTLACSEEGLIKIRRIRRKKGGNPPSSLQPSLQRSPWWIKQ